MAKRTIDESIIKAPLSGMCEIDVEKAIKYFNNKCVIYKYKDTYTLVRTTHNNKRIVLKVKIKESDAKEIIKRNCLIELPDFIFKHGSTFKKGK